jgi:hypothetical protein
MLTHMQGLNSTSKIHAPPNTRKSLEIIFPKSFQRLRNYSINQISNSLTQGFLKPHPSMSAVDLVKQGTYGLTALNLWM